MHSTRKTKLFDNWEEYHIVSKNFNNMMEKIKILKIDVYEKEKNTWKYKEQKAV